MKSKFCMHFQERRRQSSRLDTKTLKEHTSVSYPQVKLQLRTKGMPCMGNAMARGRTRKVEELVGHPQSLDHSQISLQNWHLQIVGGTCLCGQNGTHQSCGRRMAHWKVGHDEIRE